MKYFNSSTKGLSFQALPLLFDSWCTPKWNMFIKIAVTHKKMAHPKTAFVLFCFVLFVFVCFLFVSFLYIFYFLFVLFFVFFFSFFCLFLNTIQFLLENSSILYPVSNFYILQYLPPKSRWSREITIKWLL